jgi:hypothetical protein
VAPLLEHCPGNLTRPVLQMAGRDVSHWFDADTGDVRRHVDPVSLVRCYYTPQGRFVHVPPPWPDSAWATDFGLPWWLDPAYCIGRLSRKVRKVKIVNTLTGDEDVLEVCAEETIASIRNRYLEYNADAHNYAWKRLGKPLDLQKTLDENDIEDQTEEFYELDLDEDYYIPALTLYYSSRTIF